MTSRSAKRKKQRARAPVGTPTAAPARSYALPCALLFAGVFFLYAGSYQYPLVFDDRLINPVELPRMATFCTTLEKRCMSYSTFSLTYLAVGLDLFWFRFGNVLCHALATLACFLFLDRLFDAVRRQSPDGAGANSAAKDRLLAFCGAVLFAVHPVAVYAVGYLVQRSTVMATMFSLLSLTAFVRALSDGGRRWLWVAVALYAAALLSKEHAIMLPAVALAIAVLLGKRVMTTRLEQFALAAAIVVAGTLVTLQVRHVIGTSPEYFTRELRALREASGAIFDPTQDYLGSVVTQAGLYFKYVLLWLVPYPGWMSVDIRTPIASGPLEWPFVLGVPAFLAYGAAAAWLILRRGTLGLLGLGMLFPWLLFFTEFVTARIQEPFVLYRGYLWMAGLPAILPFLARRLPPRYIVIACAVLAVALGAAARERLATFQSNLALWDDVVRKNTDLSLIFVDRGYSNRAVALMREGRNEEALRDLEMTLKLNPQSSHAYVNRGTVLSKRGEHERALADVDHAIKLDPNFADAHAERCATLLAMDDLDRALEACDTALRMAPEMPTALLNRAVVYARKRRLQDALADLNKILGFEPNHAITLYNRGMVYRDLGRPADSDQDLRASCRIGFSPACAQFRPGPPLKGP
ncbi:MAG: tetratricopeptide repeat protein [Betaproteobacteria bacterium]|nr:tetratricopeptide repeat protein [Betaproteobacteria bacterium]